MINHEYPAERLEAERRDSLLVCYCAHHHPAAAR